MDEIESLRAVVADGVRRRCISPESDERWLSQRLRGRAVKLHYDHPLVNGGLLYKKMPVASVSVSMPGGKKETFVRVGTAERWLIIMTTGKSMYRGQTFGRSSLLDLLHELVRAATNGQGRLIRGRMPLPSTGPCDDAAPDEPDPMDEIRAIDTGRGGGRRGVKRPHVLIEDPRDFRPYRNPRRGDVVEFDVPVRCPEEDPRCTEMEHVKIYIQDKRSTWLHADNLAWAVTYLRCQHFLKGVPLVDGSDPGPSDVLPPPAAPTPLDDDNGSSHGPPDDSQCLDTPTLGRGGGDNGCDVEVPTISVLPDTCSQPSDPDYASTILDMVRET